MPLQPALTRTTQLTSARRLCVHLLLGATLALSSGAGAWAADPAKLSMVEAGWETRGEAVFAVDAAYPDGVLDLGRGSATARGVTFVDGTIEFDIKPKGDGVLGIKFRDNGRRAAEVFYMRPQPNCAASEECIQYMPYENGAYEWDEYPEYQSRAPFDSIGWNHVRLVISGRRMNVFINGATTPTLRVGRLGGSATRGGISLSGAASYANLVVKPDVTDGLPAQPEIDPTAADPRYVRAWRVAGPFVQPSLQDPDLNVPTGVEPRYCDRPKATATWTVAMAQDKGILDMSRVLGSSSDASVISLGWAMTTILSDTDQTRRVSFGWLREAWVYVNGQRVFAERNLYGTPTSRGPDGRLSLENGAFDLPLKKGPNEILVALDDNFSGGQHFGWGFAMRLDSLSGLSLEETGPARPGLSMAPAGPEAEPSERLDRREPQVRVSSR